MIETVTIRYMSYLDMVFTDLIFRPCIQGQNCLRIRFNHACNMCKACCSVEHPDSIHDSVSARDNGVRHEFV